MRHLSKSPLIPLYQRGKAYCSPLWQRGVRGDFFFIIILMATLVVPAWGEDASHWEETHFKAVDGMGQELIKADGKERLSDFCNRCHDKKDYERPNIHKMLDKKGGLIKDNCTFCHVETPDPNSPSLPLLASTHPNPLFSKEGEPSGGGVLKFRLPIDKLCLGCHLKTPHLNSVNHLVKPSEEMFKVIKESEKRLGVILPLDSEGKVTCVTCHAPHEKGVVKEEKPVGKQVADGSLKEGIVYEESPWSRVFAEDKRKRMEKLGAEFKIEYRKIKKEDCCL